MRKPYFNVTARCDQCGVFTVQRKKKTTISTDGHEHVISKVVCPSCRWHSDVIKIESVA